jgi:hypothetical protein
MDARRRVVNMVLTPLRIIVQRGKRNSNYTKNVRTTHEMSYGKKMMASYKRIMQKKKGELLFLQGTY